MKQKSLVKNSIYNVVYKGLNALFPLVTIAYVSRILLASGVGKVSYAQNIAQYFITMAALGIPNYGIREIAKRQNDREGMNRTFTELFTINLISTVIFTLCYYILIFAIPSFRKDCMLHVVVGSMIVLNAINVDWFYQGVEEYKYIAVRSFCVKLFSLGLIFILIHSPEDTTKYAAINCAAVCGNYLCNIIHLKKFGIRLGFKSLNLKQHMKPIMILLGSVISVELYTLLDTTMIGAICGDTAVGYYTNSIKLVKMLITLITAIAGVLLPRLSYYHGLGEEEKCSEIVSKVFQVMLFIFVPCEIGIFALSKQIVVTFFGSSFAEAETTLRIASFLICTLGFSNLFGTQVLLTYGREKLLLMTTIAGAVSNIIMNSILIPMFQQNGAAFASVISETLVTTLSFIFARKYIKMRIDKKFWIATAASGIALAAVVSAVMMLKLPDIAAIAVSIAAGAAVYFVVNMIFRNPMIKEMKGLLKGGRQ